MLPYFWSSRHQPIDQSTLINFDKSFCTKLSKFLCKIISLIRPSPCCCSWAHLLLDSLKINKDKLLIGPWTTSFKFQTKKTTTFGPSCGYYTAIFCIWQFSDLNRRADSIAKQQTNKENIQDVALQYSCVWCCYGLRNSASDNPFKETVGGIIPQLLLVNSHWYWMSSMQQAAGDSTPISEEMIQMIAFGHYLSNMIELLRLSASKMPQAK